MIPLCPHQPGPIVAGILLLSIYISGSGRVVFETGLAWMPAEVGLVGRVEEKSMQRSPEKKDGHACPCAVTRPVSKGECQDPIIHHGEAD
jgi:hypothetical protein